MYVNFIFFKARKYFLLFIQIIRELREEVDRLKRMLSAKIAGKSHIVEPGETTVEIEEMLSESEKLMSECTMTWEQKEKQTEKIQQVIYIEIVLQALNSIKQMNIKRKMSNGWPRIPFLCLKFPRLQHTLTTS